MTDLTPEPNEASELELGALDAIKRLLDGDLGGRVRSLLLLAMAVLSAVLALLQGLADVLESLPKFQWVGVVLLWTQAAIVFLARFTRVGDVTNKPQ